MAKDNIEERQKKLEKQNKKLKKRNRSKARIIILLLILILLIGALIFLLQKLGIFGGKELGSSGSSTSSAVQTSVTAADTDAPQGTAETSEKTVTKITVTVSGNKYTVNDAEVSVSSVVDMAKAVPDGEAEIHIIDSGSTDDAIQILIDELQKNGIPSQQIFEE